MTTAQISSPGHVLKAGLWDATVASVDRPAHDGHTLRDAPLRHVVVCVARASIETTFLINVTAIVGLYSRKSEWCVSAYD